VTIRDENKRYKAETRHGVGDKKVTRAQRGDAEIIVEILEFCGGTDYIYKSDVISGIRFQHIRGVLYINALIALGYLDSIEGFRGEGQPTMSVRTSAKGIASLEQRAADFVLVDVRAIKQKMLELSGGGNTFTL